MLDVRRFSRSELGCRLVAICVTWAFLIPKRLLRKALRQNLRTSSIFLHWQRIGEGEDAAALLLAGLERRCGYCCVNTVHLQTRTLESLCLVYDSDMLLRLEPGEEETEDWIVRRSTPEQIRRTLRALVREGAPQ